MLVEQSIQILADKLKYIQHLKTNEVKKENAARSRAKP